MIEDRCHDTHSRIEKTTRYSIEDPGIDCETEAKGETDVQKLSRIWSLWQSGALTTVGGLWSIGNLCTSKGKEAVPRSVMVVVMGR